MNWVPVDLVEDPADLVPELLLELGLVVAHAERRQRHHPEVPLLDEPGLDGVVGRSLVVGDEPLVANQPMYKFGLLVSQLHPVSPY